MENTTFFLANNAHTRIGVTVDHKRFAKFEVDELSSNIVVHGENDVGLLPFGEINFASQFFFARFVFQWL